MTSDRLRIRLFNKWRIVKVAKFSSHTYYKKYFDQVGEDGQSVSKMVNFYC